MTTGYFTDRSQPPSLMVLLFILVVGFVGCRSNAVATAPVTVDPGELEAFADAFFPAKMEELHIPGVSFIFVQDGQIVLAKGYGYAELAQHTPVSPDTTVMRIGSVSKLFVATAVMQLVEQGRLDLDADVNQYLTTFQLEDTFRDPVTLGQLLTHTAGFQDPTYVSNTDPTLVEPLRSYLAKSLAARTDPPGQVFRYSNHGYALAALIVEEVSGTPFDQYVAEHIFEPLGMIHSRYLLAPPLPENMATGYFYKDDVQVAQPTDYDSDYPGGSIVSTAEDMSHFILAHLQDGCYQGARILQASTLAEMHRRQAKTPFEGQNVTYGFVEGLQGDQRLLGHSGAIRGFGSSVNLLPEHNAAYFFSFIQECDRTPACETISAFRQQLLARFFSK